MLFWVEVKKRNTDIIEGRSVSSKHGRSLNNATELPLPDFNENQEFLARYDIVDHSNTDIKDMIGEKDADNNFRMEVGKQVSI